MSMSHAMVRVMVRVLLPVAKACYGLSKDSRCVNDGEQHLPSLQRMIRTSGNLRRNNHVHVPLR